MPPTSSSDANNDHFYYLVSHRKFVIVGYIVVLVHIVQIGAQVIGRMYLTSVGLVIE